jgi:hypothetical protein
LDTTVIRFALLSKGMSVSFSAAIGGVHRANRAERFAAAASADHFSN